MKFYEVDSRYIDYLLPFAPLSSYKPKHEKMKEGLDFIKVGNYVVININNMFPVPEMCYTYVDFSRERKKTSTKDNSNYNS